MARWRQAVVRPHNFPAVALLFDRRRWIFEIKGRVLDVNGIELGQLSSEFIENAMEVLVCRGCTRAIRY